MNLKNTNHFIQNLKFLLFFHWNYELEAYPMPYQRAFMLSELIDLGFDLIVGGHPHRIQGFEYLQKCSNYI